jgi:hypothetical protein
MHILLINANPVVSRLLALCTRDAAVVLDEVSTVEDVPNDVYDLVFVDEASYGRGVADLLVKLGHAKKVFISYRSDVMRGFNETIKKPFLPSQITDIIKNVELQEVETPTEDVILDIQNNEAEEETSFDLGLASKIDNEEALEVEHSEDNNIPTVLDSDEIDKIKALLDMDDDLDIIDEVLSEDEIEERKVALIKEQLIADGLEIVEEEEIVAELSIDLDGTLIKHSDLKKKSKSPKNKKSKSKKIKFTEENMERIEDAVEMAMATMTKKQMKQLLKGKEIEVSVKLEDND